MANKEVNKEKKKNNFFKELKAELKKVSWPTPKKLVNNTSAVISIILIVAAIVFVLDVCFENLNEFAIGTLKGLVSANTEEVQEVEETENAAITETEEQENVSTETEQPVENTVTDTEAPAEDNSAEEVVQ